ncbi:TonB-dependent receptor [Dyella agri]|uniref:TonB-dependent receptor n=1 Tax=Dyella agri TaxID=1926869 RepID=A0ABW8KD29_9GAMM
MKTSKNIPLRQTGLATALGLLLASTAAYGQSTTGSIFGHAPVQAGESVMVSNGAGLTRTVGIDSQGRYNASQLPIGTYTVSLMRDGQVIQQRDNVALKVGAGSEVSFSAEAAAGGAANAKQLSGVSVSANALPPIDVSSVDSRTVVTSQQLAALPLPHSAEAAALLAPGSVSNASGAKSTTGNPLISFGGAAAPENAYYINGFNTTDPNGTQGGLTLPYGSIDQEEVYTGGYSAQYGRSDGGVLNMVGKSGTNEWHFGGQYLYQPESLRSNQVDTYYANGLPPSPVAGGLYQPNSKDRQWESIYDLYVGGPLIKDKLFFFASIEASTESNYSVNPVTSGTSDHTTTHLPKYYAKINWNINANNLLELTAASSKQQQNGSIYNYNYANLSDSSFRGYQPSTKSGGNLWLGKFTSYITDSLTLTALYGKMNTFAYSIPVAYDPSNPFINGATNQNPAYNGGVPNNGVQTIGSLSNPHYRSDNLRLSLTYTLGNHTITGGIDNVTYGAFNAGSASSGPGYTWSYDYTTTPTAPISPGLGVPAIAGFPNGASGYYVEKDVFNNLYRLKAYEDAQYLEDQWQVNDRWLVSIGIRNDTYINKINAEQEPYIRQTKPTWQPRIGFSWDVNGDGTFKVYGNAGRYNLGTPLASGNAANGYTSTQQYFTYSGIAANGVPTGLTQVSVPVSANAAFGQLPDPRTVTATSLKSQEQDEFILGFTKTAGDHWVYGSKFTRRLLRHDIDDYCDLATVSAVAAQQGITDVNQSTCYYINPGEANTFAVQDPTGAFHSVTLSNAQMAFPHMVRSYYSLETFLEHPFDGKWYGKVDYLFSRSYGNTEGQSETDIGSSGGTQNTDWDFPQLMYYANGAQGNDHTHQIKAFGYYQITPEWQVSGNLELVSGGPKYCLGLYGPNQGDPVGYGSLYPWCNGQPSPPGANGRLPWMKELDLGVHYRPAFADHKLALSVEVFNVTNSQVALNRNWQLNANDTGTPNPLYGTPVLLQQPRYVRFGITYDY